MRSFVLVMAVLLALSLTPYPQPPASASCAAPILSVVDHPDSTQIVLVRGTEIVVSGKYFIEGCDDEGRSGSTFGCSGDDDVAVEAPMSDVELVLLHGRSTMTQTPLGVADATGELGSITWTVSIPPDQPLGRAVLKTEGSEPLPVGIVR